MSLSVLGSQNWGYIQQGLVALAFGGLQHQEKQQKCIDVQSSTQKGAFILTKAERCLQKKRNSAKIQDHKKQGND